MGSGVWPQAGLGKTRNRSSKIQKRHHMKRHSPRSRTAPVAGYPASGRETAAGAAGGSTTDHGHGTRYPG